MSNEKESSGVYRIFHLLTGVLAVLVSWYLNKSVLWCIVHFVFAWVYLVYCVIMKEFSGGKYQLIIDFYFN